MPVSASSSAVWETDFMGWWDGEHKIKNSEKLTVSKETASIKTHNSWQFWLMSNNVDLWVISWPDEKSTLPLQLLELSWKPIQVPGGSATKDKSGLGFGNLFDRGSLCRALMLRTFCLQELVGSYLLISRLNARDKTSSWCPLFPKFERLICQSCTAHQDLIMFEYCNWLFEAYMQESDWAHG